MKGKWIFRHHAPMGDRQTYKDLFFGVTNITHPEGHLFLVEDGTWSSKWSDQFASSHDRGPMSLRAFKKYLRKHPELEVFGNVMSLCSRYRGLAPLSNPEPNSDGMYEFDCHIDAIYVPVERKGFPEHNKSVKAFVRMNEGNYKRLDLCFFKDRVPNTFKYLDDNFNVLGEVLYWEYNK